MATDWFSVATGSDLEQGDLIRSCPIYRVETPSQEEATVIQEDHDVVLLTQTCDLENDKVEDVLVAAVRAYSDLVAQDGATNQYVKSSKFRKAAIDGNLPSYFLLPVREDNPALQWSLVDFHNVLSVPKTLLSDVASEHGERLRLVSPYKEHLAQAFARYIMRVGLPTTLHAFEKFDAKATAK